jgi:hypothetical protein
MQTKKALKIIVVTFIITVLLSVGITVFASAQSTRRQLDATFSGISVILDGRAIDLRDGAGRQVEPFIVDGTTYLPIRAISEALGLSVEWDGTTQTVYLGSGSGTQPQPQTQPTPQLAPQLALETTPQPTPQPQSQTQDFRDLLWYRGDPLFKGSQSFLRRGIEIPADEGGFTFVNGILNQSGQWFGNGINAGDSYFNLNAGYTRLTANGGMGDSNSSVVAVVRFFGDDVLLGEFTLRPEETIEIDISLVGVNTLRVSRPNIQGGSRGNIYNVRIYPVN